MNIKIPIHRRNVQARLESVRQWKVPDEVKQDIRRFLDDLEIGKVNRGKRISEARRLKYLDLLKIPLEFWNKDVASINSDDVEQFERALISDRIISTLKGKPFMPSTKSDIRKTLKVFLRWKLGREKALSLVEWLDTRVPKRTRDYLSESEVEKLFKNCRSAEQRFLVAVLFDSGARAEEFHNIRLEDIQLPTGKDNYVRLTLKEEFSKTLGRVIALYWKHSLDAVKEFMKERINEGARLHDPVFNKRYDASRQTLNRLGQSVLGKSIHYHLFRHSSVTYYANKMNRQELCYRYGWTFSSKEVDDYISRSGMMNREVDARIETTQVGELRMTVDELKTENRFLHAALENLKQEFKEVLNQVREYTGNVNSISSNLRRMSA